MIQFVCTQVLFCYKRARFVYTINLKSIRSRIFYATTLYAFMFLSDSLTLYGTSYHTYTCFMRIYTLYYYYTHSVRACAAVLRNLEKRRPIYLFKKLYIYNTYVCICEQIMF